MIRLRAALTARHSTLLAVLAVGASFAIVALAFALLTLNDAREREPSVPRVQLHPALVVPEAAVRPRCTTCGVVEGILVTQGKNGAASSYEFAIRMHDGSLRHSSDSHPGRWQVGDGIQLLGGGRTWSER